MAAPPSDVPTPSRPRSPPRDASAAAGIPALVIDAEQTTPRLGIAADLARALRADCVPLPDLDAERLEAQLRGRVGPGRPG